MPNPLALRTSRPLATALLAVAAVTGIAACGSDDTTGAGHSAADHAGMDHAATTTITTPGKSTVDGADAATSTTTSTADRDTRVDAAFVRQMIPHHQLAVAMAKAVEPKAKRTEVQQLAAAIITTQTAEIAQLRGLAKRSGSSTADADAKMGADAKLLGLPMDDMGMSMGAGSIARSKDPDLAFVRLMIPHHEGAIAMAQAELDHGQSPEIQALAKNIVAAQQKEVDEMKTWLKDWS